jgi:type IV pilus assembly protein PilO
MSPATPSVWRERLSSPLTWHYAGTAVLLAAALVLAVRFGLDWAATNDRSTSVAAQKQVQLKALDLETAPLRGLEKRVVDSREQMRAFYQKRIPPNYSTIDAHVGELAVKAPVRLTRVQYSQLPPGADLTEIRMDANITGEYPHILRFINSLERSEIFFVIRAMTLTGQQGGTVSLRLQVSTWMRPDDAAASGLPAAGPETEATPTASKEGY